MFEEPLLGHGSYHWHFTSSAYTLGSVIARMGLLGRLSGSLPMPEYSFADSYEN